MVWVGTRARGKRQEIKGFIVFYIYLLILNFELGEAG
jgi:hypothetical protein